MSGNNELNKFTHDPEEGPWMTRDRRGRARMEEEVRSNPVVAGPAGEDGTLPTLEINLNSFNHFPTLPLPTGAPLGQGGSLQGPSNQEGGAQAAEGGQQGVQVPITEGDGAGEANLEAPKSVEGEAKPDSEDDDLQVVQQVFMANPTTDYRLKNEQYRARVKATVEKKRQLMKKKSSKKSPAFIALEQRHRARVGNNSEQHVEFPMNRMRAAFRIPRNSEAMEQDQEPEMATVSEQESEPMTTDGASSDSAQQGPGVKWKLSLVTTIPAPHKEALGPMETRELTLVKLLTF